MSNRTEIFLVLDRSGSMDVIREDVIGGLNSFVREQAKQEGECYLSAIQFDHEWNAILDGKPIGEVPEWTPATYIPRGGTALLDAIHRGIGMLEERLRGVEGETNKVVVIMTDGLENASREVDKKTVMDRVERLKRDGWGFVYLGANQDAIHEGGGLGVDVETSATFAANSLGVKSAAAYATRAISDYRWTGMTSSLNATPSERSNMVGGNTSSPLLTPEEAAQALGVSSSTLSRMRSSGQGPAYTKPSPGKVRYQRDDLTGWLEDQKRR